MDSARTVEVHKFCDQRPDRGTAELQLNLVHVWKL